MPSRTYLFLCPFSGLPSRPGTTPPGISVYAHSQSEGLITARISGFSSTWRMERVTPIPFPLVCANVVGADLHHPAILAELGDAEGHATLYIGETADIFRGF